LTFKKKYLPAALDKISTELKLDDMDIKQKYFVNFYIKLQNINFKIGKLLSENISLTFQEPNKLIVKAKKLSGNGSVDTNIKTLAIIKAKDKITLDVKDLEITAECTLDKKPSKEEKDKFMPTASITNLDIKIDFDFDVKGSLVGWIARKMKNKIRAAIDNAIQTTLKELILKESKGFISDLVDQLPVYMPLTETGFAIDYSLVSEPKIKNNLLILNSRGTIVNLNKPETKTPDIQIPDTLPEYDEKGKRVQVILSDYSINSALNTVFLSELIDFSIDSSIIDPSSTFQLNTTSLDVLIDGLSDKYGKDKLVSINCKAGDKRPNLLLNADEFFTTVKSKCSLSVQKDAGFEKALSFGTAIEVNGKGSVEQGGKIKAQLITLEIKDSTIHETTLPQADIKNIEILFNFISKIAVPILNDKYLKDIPALKIPTFDGISLDDSTVSFKPNFVQLNADPKFENSPKKENNSSLKELI